MTESFKPKITYRVSHTYIDQVLAVNVANVMEKPDPWEKWFAWKPVVDIHGERWWMKTVYRRLGKATYANVITGPYYEYGTIFDVLKDTGDDRNRVK